MTRAAPPRWRSEGRFHARRIFLALVLLGTSFFLTTCSRAPSVEPGTVTFLMESMPTNLDPRIGTDAQSEALHSLIFS
jgi:peptide/nickel transport system substrate-binding protein